MKKQMNKAQKGFTLIELMVVVAITGVLAAIAIPAYQDYATRAKVTDALTQAGVAKSGVADYYNAKNATLPTTNTQAGMGIATTYATDVVDSVSVGAAGVITVAIANAVDEDITATADQLTFTPDTTAAGGIEWTCAQAATNPLPAKFLPGSCR